MPELSQRDLEISYEYLREIEISALMGFSVNIS